jgi:hypothetical protein
MGLHFFPIGRFAISNFNVKAWKFSYLLLNFDSDNKLKWIGMKYLHIWRRFQNILIERRYTDWATSAHK